MTTPFRMASLSLLLAGVASCQSPFSHSEQVRLAEAEEKWARRGFADYAIEMMAGCFCPTEVNSWVRVEVVNGRVQRVVILSSEEVINDERLNWWRTVEEVFESIRSDAEGDWLDDVQFTLDEELGYPTLVMWISSPDVLDAGGTLSLRNPTPLR